MSSRWFAIERWAERCPRVRYPLIFIALLLLWGIGGGVAP